MLSGHTPGTERVERTTRRASVGCRDLKPTTPPRILRYRNTQASFLKSSSSPSHLCLPYHLTRTSNSHHSSPHLICPARRATPPAPPPPAPSFHRPADAPRSTPRPSRDLPRAQTLTARRGAADDSHLDSSSLTRHLPPLRTSSAPRPRPVSVLALPHSLSSLAIDCCRCESSSDLSRPCRCCPSGRRMSCESSVYAVWTRAARPSTS